MISFKQKGDFSKTEKLLKKSLGGDYRSVLEKYGKKGVELLSAATPVRTGLTASSWGYEIFQNGPSLSVSWYNTNMARGVISIAVILDVGHGTRNGGYVSGRNYIEPALRPIFKELADAAWKEVTSL